MKRRNASLLNLGYENEPSSQGSHHHHDFGYQRDMDNNYIPSWEDFRYSGYQGYPSQPYSHNGLYRMAFNGHTYSSPFLY